MIALLGDKLAALDLRGDRLAAVKRRADARHCGNREHFVGTARIVQDRTRHHRRQRRLGHPLAQQRQTALLVQRSQTLQVRERIRDVCGGRRRRHEIKARDLIDAQRLELEDVHRQVALHELRRITRSQRLVIIQTQALTRRRSPSAPSALRRRGSRETHLGQRVPVPHLGIPRIDDVPDAIDRHARLCHIRRHDHLALPRRPRTQRDALLLRRQRRIQRHGVHASVRQRLHHALNLVLPRHEHQHIPRRRRLVQRHDRMHAGRHDIVRRRRVRHLDGVRAPLYSHDGRSRPTRIQVPQHALRFERRTRHDNPQRRPPPPDLLQHGEQQVRVRAPLMRLVDHHDAISMQQRIPHALAKEHAGRRVPQPRARRMHLLVKADRIADLLTQAHLPLLRHMRGHRRRRHPPRLRTHNLPLLRPPRVKQVLRHLRRLATARLADQHHDRVLLQRIQDARARSLHRQRRRTRQPHRR